MLCAIIPTTPPVNRFAVMIAVITVAPDTITRLCEADAFDDLCTDDSGYDTDRESACRNNPEDVRCPRYYNQSLRG